MSGLGLPLFKHFMVTGPRAEGDLKTSELLKAEMLAQLTPTDKGHPHL